MRSLRSALVFIGAAGVVFGVLAVVVIFTSSRQDLPVLYAMLTVLPSWSFIGTGLFAWWRRPSNRTGLQMVLVGFGWLFASLSLSDLPVLFGISMFTANVGWILLAVLLLSFPTGRLQTRFDRVLVGLFVLDAIVLTSVTGMVSGPDLETFNCEGCPTNPIALSDSPGLARVLDAIAAWGGVVLLVILITVLVRRYRASGSTNRAAVRPVLAAGAVSVLAIGVLVIVASMDIGQTPQKVVFTITVLLMSCVPFAFLAGLLRSRFTSAGAVGELVARLGETREQDLDIRGALADALGDETLDFYYWLPDRGGYVDGEGRAVELPAEGSGRSWSPVEHDGELIAAIVHDDSIADDQDLVRSTGAAAAIALRNQRLDAELRANVEELRASRWRIVNASDTERRKLERNLHDGAQQHLVSMALTLRMAANKIDDDPEAAKALLTEASENLAEATTELRELARGIHPAILTDRGLAAAISALASRSPIPVDVDVEQDQRLPTPVESAAYFVAAEALTNVARYANATRASVSVARENGVARIEVTDDGVGGADIGTGTGLRGLQDRVAALDGELEIVSIPEQGTTVRAEFPCAQ